MIPVELHYFGYVVFACLAMYTLVSAWRLFTGRIRNYYRAAVYAMASTYALGMACKLTIIGPEFMRWHLTDFGFTTWVSLLLFHFVQNRTPLTANMPVSERRGIELGDLRWRSIMLVVTLVLSVVYELLTGWMYTLKPGVRPVIIGNFDWMDVLMYFIGTAISLTMVHLWRRRLIVEYGWLEADETKAAEQAKREARIQKTLKGRERAKRQNQLSGNRPSYRRKKK